MSKPQDLVIEDGVLRNYVGTDTEVIIPNGVSIIGDYYNTRKTPPDLYWIVDDRYPYGYMAAVEH